MVEKQASSEIAQSRERFLKSVGMIERLYRERVKQHGDLARLDNLLEEWFDQAERDTRERCAQERKELLKNLASAMRKVLPSQLLQDVIDQCDPLSAFLREIGEKSLAECIRGKE